MRFMFFFVFFEFFVILCSFVVVCGFAIVGSCRFVISLLTWLRSDASSLVFDPLHRGSEVDIANKVSEFLN